MSKIYTSSSSRLKPSKCCGVYEKGLGAGVVVNEEVEDSLIMVQKCFVVRHLSNLYVSFAFLCWRGERVSARIV
jgi:hypothetical protein